MDGRSKFLDEKKWGSQVKQGKFGTVFWVKAMLWLLLIMFIFTIAGRVASSFTVAQVKAESPASRKLLYSVKAEGRIGKNRELSVLCQPGILLQGILVSEGQRVEKGEALAKLDEADVKEQIESLENKRRSFVLQNQEYQKNQEQEKQKREQEIARAKEDYAQAKEKNKSAVTFARKERKKAELMLKRARRKKIPSDKTVIASLEAEVEEKKKALEDALETKRTEEKAAKRALEDALVPLSLDSRIAVNRISIGEIDTEIKKLQKIQEQKCRITAPGDGVITLVLANVGEKTPDSALFAMTDDSAGLKFTGQITLEDAKYVSAGDRITLKNRKNTLEDVRVTAVEMDESKEFMNVTAILPAETFSYGETVSMIAEQESKNYSCTIPVTAVHQENGRYYVLMLETQDTVLGQQMAAVKAEVTVLERNGQFAALDEGVLSDDSQIITDTDRYVAAGDRVRLKGE